MGHGKGDGRCYGWRGRVAVGMVWVMRGTVRDGGAVGDEGMLLWHGQRGFVVGVVWAMGCGVGDWLDGVSD